MNRHGRIIILFFILSLLLLLPACYKRTIREKRVEVEEAAQAVQEAEFLAGQNASCYAPLIKINNECCLDENNNTACDKYETAVCGNNACETGENQCTCAQDCGQCETQQAGACQQFTCENNLCVVKQDSFCCGDGLCSVSESCDQCFQDCCSLPPAKDTLLEFETMMQKWDVVVGDNAPPKDVAISTDILTAMQRYLIKRMQKNVTVGKGILASEALPLLQVKDYIVMGNPCDNSAAQELLKKDIVANYNTKYNTNANNDDNATDDTTDGTSQSCQIFQPGESMLRLVPTSERTVSLYIGGYSWRETEAAAQILIQQAESNNTRYNLDGREFRVLGEKGKERIIAVI